MEAPLSSRNRPSLALWAISAVLLAVTVVYAALIGPELLQQFREWPTLHRDRDFPSYYLAAQRLLRGEDFYSGLQEEARQLGIDDYFIDAAVNLPTFTLVSVPLAFVSYPVAWVGWQVLSLAALALSVLLALRELQVRLPLPGWVILGSAIVLFPPLAFHLLYAHTELLLLLLLTGAWVFLRRGKEVPAGVLLGLAGVLRVYPLLLAVYLLLRRSWKAFWAALASGVGLVGLAALVAGPSSYLRYLSSLRDVVPGLYPRNGNLSLWGSVYKMASIWPALGERPALRDLVAVLISGGLVALTVWLTRRPGRSLSALDREYGLFVVAALLASPLSWIYYQVLLYLPLLILWVELQRGHRQPIRLGVLVAALLAALSPFFGGRWDAPIRVQRMLSFLPTLTLVGLYIALALPVFEAEGDPSFRFEHLNGISKPRLDRRGPSRKG